MRLNTKLNQSLWGRSERPYLFGLLGTFLGILAVLAAAHFNGNWLGHEQRPAHPHAAPVTQQEQRALSIPLGGDRQLRFSATTSTAASPQPTVATHAAEAPTRWWDWLAKSMGALALLLCLVALVKKEDWRPILMAFVLGITGLAFTSAWAFAQMALAILIVIAIVTAVLGALGM